MPVDDDQIGARVRHAAARHQQKGKKQKAPTNCQGFPKRSRECAKSTDLRYRSHYFGAGVGAVGDVAGLAGGVDDGFEVAGSGDAPGFGDGIGFSGVASGAGAAIFDVVNKPAPVLVGAGFGLFANSSVSEDTPPMWRV